MPNLNQARDLEFQSPPESGEHSLPKRRERDSKMTCRAQWHESAFAAVGSVNGNLIAVEAVEDFLHEMDHRVRTLAAGKGGPLYPRESVFAVQSPWVYGYLGLVVDEERGEVQRYSFDAPVCFEPDSLTWTVFLAAWDEGEPGCSPEKWDLRDDLLQDPIREKSTRRDLNQKLRILGIRLVPRCLPRLVECSSPRR